MWEKYEILRVCWKEVILRKLIKKERRTRENRLLLSLMIKRLTFFIEIRMRFQWNYFLSSHVLIFLNRGSIFIWIDEISLNHLLWILKTGGNIFSLTENWVFDFIFHRLLYTMPHGIRKWFLRNYWTMERMFMKDRYLWRKGRILKMFERTKNSKYILFLTCVFLNTYIEHGRSFDEGVYDSKYTLIFSFIVFKWISFICRGFVESLKRSEIERVILKIIFFSWPIQYESSRCVHISMIISTRV